MKFIESFFLGGVIGLFFIIGVFCALVGSALSFIVDNFFDLILLAGVLVVVLSPDKKRRYRS